MHKLEWMGVLAICGMFCFTAAGSALAYELGHMPAVVIAGNEITADGSLLRGVNDQTVLVYQMYPYPTYSYRYCNHLFCWDGTGYTTDAHTKLMSGSLRNFWWQYFYLVQSLNLNNVRLGGFDAWGLSWLHSIYHNSPSTWSSVWDPMLEMAERNGVWLTVCLGTGTGEEHFSKTDYSFGSSVANPTSGSIYAVGSETYEEYVSFVSAVINTYKSDHCIAIWDLGNEPDADSVYSSYWLPTYGTATAARNAFVNWTTALTADVKAAVGTCQPIMIGTGGGTFFGWGETYFDERNSGSVDVVGSHTYGTAQDDYLINDPKGWADTLGKPVYNGEAGYALASPPWTISYWPWLDNICTNDSIGLAWMTLNSYPGYPVSMADIMMIPTTPGTDSGTGGYVEEVGEGATFYGQDGSGTPIPFGANLSGAASPVADGGAITLNQNTVLGPIVVQVYVPYSGLSTDFLVNVSVWSDGLELYHTPTLEHGTITYNDANHPWYDGHYGGFPYITHNASSCLFYMVSAPLNLKLATTDDYTVYVGMGYQLGDAWVQQNLHTFHYTIHVHQSVAPGPGGSSDSSLVMILAGTTGMGAIIGLPVAVIYAKLGEGRKFVLWLIATFILACLFWGLLSG